ncbi:MAG: long-chain-fatty-acid--CoA ligase [Cellvibrionaceae bacterium]
MMNLTQLLHRNVQQNASREAISFEGQSWTYAELHQRVARMAGALRNLGVKDGERVALMSLNSSRYIEYLMAVPWANGVVNPVNTRWSAAETVYSLKDSGTRILMIDKAFAPLLPEIKAQAEFLEHIIYADDGDTPEGAHNYETLLKQAQPIEDACRGGDDLAGIFYTGGTTGFPKGVMLSHSNFMTSAISLALAAETPDAPRYMHAAPMFHIADMATVLMTFLRGGTQVVVRAFDPDTVQATVRDQHVTDALLVPTMVQMLLDSPNFDAANFSSWQRMIYGASPMPSATLDRMIESLPLVKLYQAYGMTELAPLATVNPPENHTAEARESGLIRSAGRSGVLQDVRIVDENRQECPRGQVGEITVRGPNVMQGYWGKPEQTAQAIVDGWMHTGDGGYMDENGFVFVVDRVKDMIISGGENIYSAEVESVVSQHPQVSQCAVIGIPSEQWGEAVHVVIVPASENFSLTVEALRDFCRAHIAGYKCPQSISTLEALPLSGAGKILKTELRKPYWEGHDKGVA